VAAIHAERVAAIHAEQVGSRRVVTEPPIIAFLSTGRCGTQWLAAGLRALHPELDVEHEPIGPLYKPRRYFRSYDDVEAILDVPEVARHVARIARAERPYVETGWPLFPVLPLLAARFPARLRIVHLTRHPVPSALSHLAHSSYAGSPRADAYTRWATLGPGDAGVFGPHYAARWERLSPYEKCLFWWTEVHLYGLELPERLTAIPFLRAGAETLLAGERSELERLLGFIGVEWRDAWLAHAERVVDRWRHHTDLDVDPLAVLRHPDTVRAAAQLGYDAGQVDLDALEARYRGVPDAGLDRIRRYA
jgi:hypothetical protein